MSKGILPTTFVPAGRKPPSHREAQHQVFADRPFLCNLLDAVPTFIAIFNEQRQAVFTNKALREALGIESRQGLGLRTGEMFGCRHAHEGEGGCGATDFCRYCGGTQAILSSLRGKEAVRECRITDQRGDALDFRVWTTPLLMSGETYSMTVFQDISSEKRRKVLERIFFHDILNTAGGLLGLAEILKDSEEDATDDWVELMYVNAADLVAEIKAQRLLSNAENGDLGVQPEMLVSTALLEELICTYANHHVAHHRIITMCPNACTTTFESDRTLVKRVLGNMVKNALEAVQPGDTVTLDCAREDDDVVFQVHNPTYMPEKVQKQIFKRSFSTKGTDRGVGTYSMRLLSERYLRGHVSFTSSREHGTTFTARYPLLLMSTRNG
ncbi:MAG: ATP-binding protein [Rhodothermales bacterium]